MKNILFALVILLSSCSTPVHASGGLKHKSDIDTNILQQLAVINYNSYVGKPVDSLIFALPSGIISMEIMSGSRVEFASYLLVKYNNGLWLKIFVEQFTFMDPRDANRVWNITQFKKEKIAHALVYDRNACIINCTDKYF